ncbi:hypothetical protein OHD62_23870 [Mesorhizobium sp. YC-39]|uniref:hypothetical protein n=1 Tax=unclassified Mesorhizobium TaxID=325217 RepID=UPI0021E9206C|nr:MULTISPECIES: hypothetical protein [unclassified Mesorhizobium]MCV3209227.1 hypothetical protein [Mesorhizobium sp. YC-2]MCV3231423.1 hypothetical protein [Mesorhizobium sp. YC-39]
MPIRPIASTAGAILFAATSMAYARPDTRTMTCEQTQLLIQSRHAAVLTTGPNTYDRYVRQFGNECDWPEVPIASYVRTRDGQCLVHRCQEPVFDFPD